MKYLSEVNGSTALAAVIGSPIQHSKSPRIYNSCFEQDQLDIVYLAFETNEADTVKRIEALKQLSVKGINITMPGKVEALKCVDQVDEAAQYVQAINTIIPQDNGWTGYNTDGKGFWNAVKEHDVTISDAIVTLYGSGSTTRIILVQAVLEGAKEVNIIARNIERPLKIKSIIEMLLTDYPEVTIHLIQSDQLVAVKEAVNKADILVQTTSVGMSPNESQSLLTDPSWLNPETMVCDVVYEPRETLFLKQAKSQQCKTMGGIEMLVHQAALNYSLMTGLKMSTQDVLKIIDNK